VHGSLLDKVGQDKEHAFRLSNALSPDLQYYRLSMTPSLLDKIHLNVKAGYGNFALFEMGRIHNKNEKDEEGLPREVNTLAFVITAESKVANQEYGGAAYYEARTYLERLLTVENVRDLVTLEPLKGTELGDNPWTAQLVAPYDPNRSALLRGKDGLIWGVLGEFKPSVRNALKLPAFTAGFELDPLLLLLNQVSRRYVYIPRFPKVEQDICLKVDADVSYQQVHDFVARQITELAADNLQSNILPVDIYQRPDDKAHKQITLRLSIASYEKTLTDAEVTRLLDDVAQSAEVQLHAQRV
jgi:phenylalanyl-tRNA synthetase beta chain